MEFVKYENRKYYSADRKGHVTLGEIMRLRLAGVRVKVVCHKTRNDITGACLARAALPRLEKALLHHPEQLQQLEQILREGFGV